jgi:hypothetical protein
MNIERRSTVIIILQSVVPIRQMPCFEKCTIANAGASTLSAGDAAGCSWMNDSGLSFAPHPGRISNLRKAGCGRSVDECSDSGYGTVNVDVVSNTPRLWLRVPGQLDA